MKPRAEETQPLTCCPLGICAMCGNTVKTPFLFKIPGLKKTKPDLAHLPPRPAVAAAARQPG